MAADLLSTSFPGAELVSAGLRDLALGRETAEALLVEAARSRLSDLGLAVPPSGGARLPYPEIRLYRLLSKTHPRNAYGEYNARLRRLAKYIHAVEHHLGRARRSEELAEELAEV